MYSSSAFFLCLINYLKSKNNGKEKLSIPGVIASSEGGQGKKVSNTQLAQCMGLSQSTVSRLISGQITLTVQHLYDFANALQIPIEDLIV